MTKWKAFWRKIGKNPFAVHLAPLETMIVELDDEVTKEQAKKMAKEVPAPEGFEFFRVEKIP